MADQLDLLLVAEKRIVGLLGRPIATKQQSVGWSVGRSFQLSLSTRVARDNPVIVCVVWLWA